MNGTLIANKEKQNFFQVLFGNGCFGLYNVVVKPNKNSISMQKNYLSDKEFSEFVYCQLEKQCSSYVNFAKVLCGAKAADDVLCA
mgnify:CR=1 FL=1